jgi:ribosomal protein L37AE/L43A
MGAGWLYYHKYPPKRKCPVCGKRHYLRRVGRFSNGEDIWEMPPCNKGTGKPQTTLTISTHGIAWEL